MKYWKNGFYEGPQDGSVEITDEYWQELLHGQSSGFEIRSNADGHPILIKIEPSQQDINENRIVELKAKLTNTDYMAIKVADGAMTVEEYEPVKLQRASWRAEINELEI